MTYRKKRIIPAKNKNLAKVLRRKDEGPSASLGDVYPTVNQLVIKLEFLDARGNLLGDKTLEFNENDVADFRTDCMGPCGDGRMDLEGKIKEVIERGDASGIGRGKCSRIVYAGSSDTCNYELRAMIEVNYR